MFTRVSRSRQRRAAGEGGFTLIELLVVIVILGVLAAVVVFAVGGVRDKGETSALKIDARTIATAEEAYCAKYGSYGTVSDLVGAGLLAAPPALHNIATSSYGTCTSGNQPDKAGFALGYAKANAGIGTSVSQVTLAASGGNPNPFVMNRGPLFLLNGYLFDSLLWRDGSGNVIPWLATDVPTVANGGISADGKTYTFHIRQGVKFQDGVAMTPADVAFTIGYFAANNNNTLFKTYLSGGTTAAVNGNDVVVTLPAANNGFLPFVAQAMPVLPQHLWDPAQNGGANLRTAAATDARAYVGTGPYKLPGAAWNADGTPKTSWAGWPTTDGVIKLDSNPDFFLGQPFVRALNFVTVGPGLSIAALQTKTVDLGGIGSEEAVTDAALGSVGLPSITSPGTWNRTIEFNMAKGFPYNNLSFRQAFAYAIDRPALFAATASGHGALGSYGGLSPTHPYLAPGLPTYSRDVTKAHDLLVAAGFRDVNADGWLEWPAGWTSGLSAAERTVNGTSYGETDGSGNANLLLYTADSSLSVTAGFSNVPVDLVVSQLAQAGLKAQRVSAVPGSAAGQSDNITLNGQYGVAFIGHGNVGNDPDQLRTRFLDSLTSSVGNRQFFSIIGWNAANGGPSAADFATQATIEQTTTDAAARKAAVQQMQRDIATDVAIISLYVPDSYTFYQGPFTAWYYTPTGLPLGPHSVMNKAGLTTGKQF